MWFGGGWWDVVWCGFVWLVGCGLVGVGRMWFSVVGGMCFFVVGRIWFGVLGSVLGNVAGTGGVAILLNMEVRISVLIWSFFVSVICEVVLWARFYVW